MCSVVMSGDAGMTWHYVPYNLPYAYPSALMAWDSHILAFEHRSILRSTDHGSTWQRVVPQGWDSDSFYFCSGGQLIPGGGANSSSSAAIYAWCRVDNKARLLKVRAPVLTGPVGGLTPLCMPYGLLGWKQARPTAVMLPLPPAPCRVTMEG